MIMSLKQRRIKFKPGIKLNHNIYATFRTLPLFYLHTFVSCAYVTGQNYIQVKIFQTRLILNFLCLLAQIIHGLRLGDKGT